MNEKPSKAQENPPIPEAANDRRSMLKKSVGLAPVLLTLASRPVLAQFKSPSAWGSEQLMPAGASQHATPVALSTWTISDWAQNKPRGVLGKPWKKINASYEDVSQLEEFLVGQVLPPLGLTVPSGLDPNKKMIEMLQTGSAFEKRTAVAQLNAKYDTAVSGLITQSVLGPMANGAFALPGGSAWTKDGIAKYLKESAIALD